MYFAHLFVTLPPKKTIIIMISTFIGHNAVSSAAIYAKPLLDLNEDVKVEIMHILLNSIKGDNHRAENEEYDLYSCFSGSWGEDLSTEEYCKELREGITEPKETEAW